MAGALNLTISGTVTGLPTGTKTITGVITSTCAVGQISDITLDTGPNTITVPAGVTAVLIAMPYGNATVVTLKGSADDDGIALLPTAPTLIPLHVSQTTFVLDAAAPLPGPVELSWM